MGKSFYDCGKKDETAIFNLFYRKAPENNNWAVVSGVDEVLEMIDGLGRMPQKFFEKFYHKCAFPTGSLPTSHAI